MIIIDCGKYITNLSITVDRCTPALAAVIKQSSLFAGFLDLETNISKFKPVSLMEKYRTIKYPSA